MSKWTPGPWVVGWVGDGYTGVTGPRSVAGVWLHFCDKPRTIVSAKHQTFHGSGTVVADILLSDEFAEADARLIAAAPELAEAIQKILVYAERYEDCEAGGRSFQSETVTADCRAARALLERINK